MSAKFVWGVVLIVVGVAGVFSGIDQIAEISYLDKIVGDFSRQFSAQRHMGEYANVARDAKIGGIIKIVGSACLSIFGTWLIQEARNEERRGQQRQHPQEGGEWSLGGDNTDNNKWKF